MDILRHAWRELGQRKAQTLTNASRYALAVASTVVLVGTLLASKRQDPRTKRNGGVLWLI